MTITTYEKVQRRCQKSGPCAVCGVVTSRSITLWHTLNPWNKNEDGTVRTRAEIALILADEAKEWMGQPVVHARCERGQR